VSITYTVDGVGPLQFAGPVTPPADAPWGVNGYPGDTVVLQSFTDTVDLPVGVSDQKINTVLWSVDYTYAGTATDPNAWSELLFSPDVSRNISIAGAGTQTFTQAGLLDCNWDTDFLSFQGGSTVTFTIGGYQISVTPLAVPLSGAGGDANPPWVQPPQDMMAQFSVTPVPEPTTMALVLLASGASMLPIIRKSRAA
jgi:hypothetical protein